MDPWVWIPGSGFLGLESRILAYLDLEILDPGIVEPWILEYWDLGILDPGIVKPWILEYWDSSFGFLGWDSWVLILCKVWIHGFGVLHGLGLLIWIPRFGFLHGFGSLGLDTWDWTHGFESLGLDSWVWIPAFGILCLDSCMNSSSWG